MLAKITVHLREKYGDINFTSIFEKMINFRDVYKSFSRKFPP